MDTIPTSKEIRELATLKAIAMATSLRTGGDGTEELQKAADEFTDKYQPLLLDKPFTAIFNTYKQYLIAALNNIFEPGSATYGEPVQISSILDGQEVHRRNRLSLNDEQWDDYIGHLKRTAIECAHEMIDAIRDGEDTDSLLHQHNMRMAALGMDYGLTEEEDLRQGNIAAETYTKALDDAISRGV